MWKSCFRSSRLKTNVFEKLLNSFSCISFMKLFGLSVFCINFCYFSKNLVSQNFNWSNMFFDQLKIPCFSRIGLGWFDWYLIGTRMIEFRKEWKKKKKEKAFSPHVFFTFSNIFLSFSSFSLSTDPIQVFFVIFLLKSSRVFVLKYG